MRLTYGFTLVLGGLGLASPLAGQDAPETTPFADPKERVKIALPKSWNAKVRRRPKPDRFKGYTITDPDVFSREGEVLYWVLGLGEDDGKAYANLQLFPCRFFGTVTLLRGRREEVRKGANPVRSVKLLLEPEPHLLAKGTNTIVNRTRYTRGHRWLKACKRVRGWMVEFTLQCRWDVLDELRPGFFQAWSSLQVEVDRCPSKLQGFRVTRLHSMEVHASRSVSKNFLGPVVRRIRSWQSAFMRKHGRITRPKDEPLQLVVHDASKIDLKAARSGRGPLKMTKSTPWVPAYARRVHFEAFDLKDPRKRGRLRSRLQRVFLLERYGNGKPEWMMDAERFVARMREVTRKHPPPTISQYDAVEPTETLVGLARQRVPRRADQIGIYGMFLTYGPKKYKKAYTAFLKDLARSGDGQAAAKKHLYSLDQDQMRADCLEFLRTKMKFLEEL